MSQEELSGSEEIQEEQAAISEEGELTSEEHIEDSGEATSQSNEIEKPETISYSEYEALLQERDELSRQKEDKSRFITQKLEDERRLMDELNQAKSERDLLNSVLPEKSAILTREDRDNLNRADELDRYIESAQAQQAITHNQFVLDNLYPDYSTLKQDIVEELKLRGENPQVIQAIEQNPYAFPSNGLPYMKAVVDTVRLKKENSELKEKARSGVASTKDHLNKVREAASTSTISNSLGKTSIGMPESDVDQDDFVNSLSDDDLINLLKERNLD